MDGSDDYLFDDIVLDEETLADIDSKEQQYLTQVAQPPAKRQKTDNGWKPVAAQARAPVSNDEDLPEISIHGDGTYAFRGSARAGDNATLIVPPVCNKTQSVQLLHQRVVSASAAAIQGTNTRPGPPSRPPQQHGHTPARVPNASHVSQAQADDLSKQIEELRRENQKYQEELKNAIDSKYAKQGEVAILRRNIEKASQEHAAQVARLKLAKEESEAKQIALQQEMKAEMERLKTQFIFKQQEIEGSSRKPPMSVRSKRIGKDVAATPAVAPSQIRGWNMNVGFPEQSPAPTRAAKGTPSGVHSRRTPEKTRKHPKLMGFENAFADATPLRPSQSRSMEEDTFAPLRRVVSPIPFPQQFQDNKMEDFTDQLIEPGSSDPQRADPQSMDMEEFDEIAPFNWKAELTRIVLTHASPQSTSPTLKVLVGLALPFEFAEQYSNAVTRILELVANTSQLWDHDTSISGVCRYLTLMIRILNDANLTSAIAALLNLMACLSCSLPNFTSSLLLQQDKPDCPNILEVLCAIIRDRLRPNKQSPLDPDLGNESVGLLEALCWNIKDDSASRLSVICNSKDVLMILLDVSQPSWLLVRATRLLVFLAVHSALCPDLLSSSESAQPSATKTKDASRLPLIERLCSYLMDRSRNGSTEGVDIKRQILAFFAMVSLAHTEVHTTLVGCQSLIPSLVVLLTQMTTLLWDDEEFSMSSPDTTIKIIRTLNQTVFLFHHLVFGLEPHFNLRHRLHYAPSRTFNGVDHMFIVTFGRLSHADHPEWIDPAQKLELEVVTELARELLDQVVDGPEAESIWIAYNIEHSDTDDEMEEAILQAAQADDF